MGALGEELLRLAGVLLAIVGGVVLAGRLARRARAGSREPFRIVARIGLGRSGALHVVVVGERSFLIGSGEQGPRVLAELGAKDLEAVLGRGTEPREMAEIDPGTGLVEALRRATLRTSGRSRASIR
jgi:flagellar biogenesis protein FliO